MFHGEQHIFFLSPVFMKTHCVSLCLLFKDNYLLLYWMVKLKHLTSS